MTDLIKAIIERMEKRIKSAESWDDDKVGVHIGELKKLIETVKELDAKTVPVTPPSEVTK